MNKVLKFLDYRKSRELNEEIEHMNGELLPSRKSIQDPYKDNSEASEVESNIKIQIDQYNSSIADKLGDFTFESGPDWYCQLREDVVSAACDYLGCSTDPEATECGGRLMNFLGEPSEDLEGIDFSHLFVKKCIEYALDKQDSFEEGENVKSAFENLAPKDSPEMDSALSKYSLKNGRDMLPGDILQFKWSSKKNDNEFIHYGVALKFKNSKVFSLECSVNSDGEISDSVHIVERSFSQEVNGMKLVKIYSLMEQE